MPRPDVPPLAAHYIDLVNQERVDELVALFHPDATIVPPLGRPRRGLEDIRTFFASVPVWYPQHHDELLRAWQGPDSMVVEVDFHGVDSAGKSVAFRALDVVDLLNGKIARVQMFFNSHDVLVQRGLA